VLIAGPQLGGVTQHTLIVPELDVFLAEIRGRGILAGPVERAGEGMRQSVIVDPDGNRLKVGGP
jgi:predicted enzyme related to lactoylglutathione lyase